MYLPAHFREDRPEVLRALMADYPLAALVSSGEAGLAANHIPLLWAASDAPHGALRGHLARANNQWKELSASPDALAIFQGPQAYISPSTYPTKHETGKAVPTWNYATVHAWGTVTIHEDPGWLRTFLHQLTDANEQRRSNPWAVDDAPADYIEALLGGIVGIELRISRIEGKWKVSQNQPVRNREGAAADLTGTPMANLIRNR